MAKEALKKLEEDLSCSICLDTYTDPKQLQCHHIFCRQCLVRLVVRDQQGQLTLTCPTCRQVTPVPANGVAGLQSAFHINHLLEIQDCLKESSLQEEAVGSATSETDSSSSNTCLEHPDEELKLYCETCTSLICCQCVIKHAKHHSHDYELLHDAFDNYKREIVSSLELMEEHLAKVNHCLFQFSTRRDEISHKQAAIETDIHGYIDQLHAILEQRRVKLTDDLHQITQGKLKSLSAQVEKIETTRAQLSSCLSKMKKSLVSSCVTEVLRMKASLIEQATELTTTIQPNEWEPNTEADMSITVSSYVVPLCQDYPRIVVPSLPDPLKCTLTGKGAERAVVGEKNVATLKAVDYNNHPCKHLTNLLVCELAQESTGAGIPCSFIRKCTKEGNLYEISYQPAMRGEYQLSIKVCDQHIRGSPFKLSARLPVQKLGVPTRCIGNKIIAPIGMALGPDSELVITQHGEHCVSVLDQNGHLMRSFGTKGSQRSQFNCPLGISVDDEGKVYVADHANHRIQKFTLEGEFLAQYGTQRRGTPQIKFPLDVAFNHTNRKVYVVDSNHWVQILDSGLTFMTTFGKLGSGKGEFRVPCAVSCDGSGKVYVADSSCLCVQIFSPDGNFLSMFSLSYMKPCSIAIDTEGLVYLSIPDHNLVSVLSSHGELLASFGKWGVGEGEFKYPHGLAVDANGYVYVCDRYNNRIQVF